MTAPTTDPDVRDDAQRWTDYLDGELDGSEAEALEADPEAEELRQVLALVGQLPPVAAPEDFYEKVERRLRRRSLTRWDGRFAAALAWPFQAVSVLVILAVAALYLFATLESERGARLVKDREAQAQDQNQSLGQNPAPAETEPPPHVEKPAGDPVPTKLESEQPAPPRAPSPE